LAYTPKLWQDRIKDSTGKIIQEGTPFSAGNMNHIEQGIADAHAQLDVASRQVQTLGHGLSILNGNNNAPVDIQIEGRTLVNVSQNVLDPAKYYVVADKKSKVKFSDGTTYAGVAKFQGRAEKPILIRVENFENKVSGSTVENPHVAKSNSNMGGSWTTLSAPSGFSVEFINAYSLVSKLDGSVINIIQNANGNMAQTLFSFNLIEAIERNVGKIPASDTAGKVAWLKNNIARITFNWWGYGSSPTGNKATVAIKNNNTDGWVTCSSHTNSAVTKVKGEINNGQLGWFGSGGACCDSNGLVHFLAYADPSDGVTASTIYTDYVELEIELNQNAQLWNPRFPLYEVDATTEYPNILTTWDENEVMRRYPMVESVQHVQNPYVMAEGDNLIPPFTDSAWTIHANAVVREPYKLDLNASGNGNVSYCIINVFPNQTYVINVDTNAKCMVYDLDDQGNNKSVLKYYSDSIPKTITPTTNRIKVYLSNDTLGTGSYYFRNPMLTLGSTAKPFVPRNPSYLFAEVKLGALSDKKDILFKDGQDWKVTKWIEKDVVLDGKLSWTFNTDLTGAKRLVVRDLFPDNLALNPISTKYNGMNMKFDTAVTNIDTFSVTQSTGDCWIAVSDTDTGFGEHYKPSVQEIQAYFNGWKANGYTTGTAVTNELTGQLASNGTYTFAQSGSYRNVVVEKSTDGSTWSPAVENTDFKIDISGTKAVLTNLSASALYFRISYNYGVTVNSWASLVDGSAPSTNTLAYVSANMASGFTPYKLSYVLATPQTIVVTDKVEGDIVVNGATQVEGGSGIVIREKIAPKQHSTTLDWYINEIGVSSSVQDSPLKYRVSKIMNIYRNGVIDSKWAQTTSSSNQNGTVYATIKNTDYDPTAEYSVTYMLLDRQSFTTNILSVTATYANNIRTALDDTIKRVEDNTTNISIQARLLYDILKRLKAGGL